jgi:type IV secretory pathway ATPase VirB11/archaellum biosynthesis ATPase
MMRLGTVLGDGPAGDSGGPGCGCDASFDGDQLYVDASDCDHGGRLEGSPPCRAKVVDALTDRDVECVVVCASGLEARYEDGACALLVAAGRFVEATAAHDSRLADRARRDPLAAAREATGRADRVSEVAAAVGLSELADRADGYATALAPTVGLVASRWRVDTAPPPGARLVETRQLDTGGTVRQYATEAGRDRYVLEPVEHRFAAGEAETLAAAHERLAAGRVAGGDRAPRRAVRTVAPDGVDVEPIVRVLRKHTRGYGLLVDLFADPAVSDAFVTAPAPKNPVRVGLGGETLPTNVRLDEGGVEALASRFRRESGRGFSRAAPTLDASVTVGDRRVRVAGVTDPASDGTGFAFRAHDREVWTLPGLVANDTLTAGAAAVLSLAVERGHSLLIAGPRGAGKTTLLGALLWEIPPAVRTVVIEDTPELPIGPLRTAGRDVQPLRADPDGTGLSPSEALRTALRLGNGALALGEVRGEEARALYEAMRVGANSEAVLGTVHGDGATATYERVVSDLGVPPSSFAATDLVVTVEIAESASQPRRIRRIEEVTGSDPPSFEPLYGRPDGGLEGSGRIDRGNSRALVSFAAPGESYADVRECLADRAGEIADLAASGRTGGRAVTAAGLERDR